MRHISTEEHFVTHLFILQFALLICIRKHCRVTLTFCKRLFSKFFLDSTIRKNKKISQMVGFEPTPSERNWFRVNRLNHSATSADVKLFRSSVPVPVNTWIKFVLVFLKLMWPIMLSEKYSFLNWRIQFINGWNICHPTNSANECLN